MKRNFFIRVKLFVLVMIFFLVNTGLLQAETVKARAKDFGVFWGVITEVDCSSGEVKMIYHKIERVFYLGKTVEYKRIKSCDDIVTGGSAIVNYSEVNGKYIISSLKSRTARRTSRSGITQGSPASRTKAKVFLGIMNTSDCKNDIITLESIKDRQRKESFNLSKDTIFLTSQKKSGCRDIEPGSVVSVIYKEKDNKKIAQKIKLMGGKRTRK